MAALTLHNVSPSGKTVSYVAAAGGGDTVKAGSRTFISVRNGGGGSVTVTVNDTKTKAPAGAAEFDPDLEVVIAPSTEKVIGPLPAERFANLSGNAEISYSGVTSVTVAALKV